MTDGATANNIGSLTLNNSANNGIFVSERQFLDHDIDNT